MAPDTRVGDRLDELFSSWLRLSTRSFRAREVEVSPPRLSVSSLRSFSSRRLLTPRSWASIRHDKSLRALSNLRSLSFNAISFCLNLSSLCFTAISLLSTLLRLSLNPAVVVAASAPTETDDCPSEWVKSISAAASRSIPLSLDEPFQVRFFGGTATPGMVLADVGVASPPNDNERIDLFNGYGHSRIRQVVDHSNNILSATWRLP